VQEGVLGFEECLDEQNVVAASSWRMRITVLAGGVISLLLLSPVLGEVYSSFGRALRANPFWVIAALGCISVGFVSSWTLQMLTLRVTRWSDVAGPQLAGNAASNLLPAGSAFGCVIQLRMLTRNRIDLTRAVTSLTISGMLSTLAGLLVFPLLMFLPVGGPSDSGLDAAARVGVIALIVCIPLVMVTLRSDRPMKWVARAVHKTLRRRARQRARSAAATQAPHRGDGNRAGAR
jgi:hypothetical protein